MLEPLSQLAAYAAVTERIVLGTSVLLLPLYHPVPLAKSLATIDHISGGRTILGVGVGGENPAEFEACGVALGERGARTDEAIDVLKGLWTGEPFDHAGPFFRIPDARMEPAPVQPGGPPVWVGGRSAAALRRVAHRGDGWIGIFLSPSRYGEAVERVTETCRANERDPEEIAFAHYLWVRVDDTHEAAMAGAKQYLERSYQRAFTDEQVPRFCAAGTPEELRARVSAYVDAGCRHVILKPACTLQEIEDQAAQLAATFVGDPLG